MYFIQSFCHQIECDSSIKSSPEIFLWCDINFLNCKVDLFYGFKIYN